ncbi:MAG: choice-of-anchor Q domain-containing protein [Phycisphaeraceae bacterium]
MMPPHDAGAATHQVDASHRQADDANTGTASAPWRSIQHAADQARPGDVIVVRPGIYDERVTVRRSGREDEPIVFRSEQMHQARVRGFVLEGDYISIEGFEITSGEDGAHGIFAGEAHRDGARTGCRMIDNHIHDIGGTAITAGEHALVKGNLMRNVFRGVFVNSGTLVEDNEVDTLVAPMIEQNGQLRPRKTQYAFFAGNDIAFRGNHFHGAPMDDMRRWGVDFVTTWDAWVFGPSRDILIENNRFFNATHGSEPEASQHQQSSHITYRNNLFVNTVFVGVLAKQWTHVTVENNTFINCGAYPVWFQTEREAQGSVVRNNLIAYYKHDERIHGGPDAESGIRINGNWHVDIANNMYWGTTNRGYSPTDFTDQPHFVDPDNSDFRLKPGSPGIDAGMTLKHITADLRGIERPQGDGYDVGAYEYTSEPRGVEDTH